VNGTECCSVSASQHSSSAAALPVGLSIRHLFGTNGPGLKALIVREVLGIQYPLPKTVTPSGQSNHGPFLTRAIDVAMVLVELDGTFVHWCGRDPTVLRSSVSFEVYAFLCCMTEIDIVVFYHWLFQRGFHLVTSDASLQPHLSTTSIRSISPVIEPGRLYPSSNGQNSWFPRRGTLGANTSRRGPYLFHHVRFLSPSVLLCNKSHRGESLFSFH
jgi:hypothetical protein